MAKEFNSAQSNYWAFKAMTASDELAILDSILARRMRQQRRYPSILNQKVIDDTLTERDALALEVQKAESILINRSKNQKLEVN